jgi:hypothetical protein
LSKTHKKYSFGSKDSYFWRIFDLSHFLCSDINLSTRIKKARYGAKNGQNEKSRVKPG